MGVDDELSSELKDIPRDECLALLRSLAIGRVAVALAGSPPLVVPVNYVVHREAIVFRTDPGTKLDLLRQAPVSFQVDLIDPCHRSGWSVLVQGVADETAHLEVDVELQSWAGGDKRHWVRVTPAVITGRRIRLPDIPVESRGYL